MATSQEPSPRIEDYGLIGDMRTCALVSKSGSIDFLCWPTFDSPSIFARILDTTKGSTGHWSIKPRLPTTSYSCKQNYLSSTNVLLTKFIHEDGVVDLTDFFAVSGENVLQREGEGSALVRKVKCLRGRMPIDVNIHPRPEYASSRSGSLTVTGLQGRRTEVPCVQRRVFPRRAGTGEQGGPPDFHPCFQVVLCPSAGSLVKDGISPVWEGTGGLAHATIELLEGQCIYMIMCQEPKLDDQKLADPEYLQHVFDLEHQVRRLMANPFCQVMRQRGVPPGHSLSVSRC